MFHHKNCQSGKLTKINDINGGVERQMKKRLSYELITALTHQRDPEPLVFSDISNPWSHEALLWTHGQEGVATEAVT